MAVEAYFKIKTERNEKAPNRDDQLYQIYFGESEEKVAKSQRVFNFVSKAIIDTSFHKFAHKMPKILKYYAIAQKSSVYDKQQHIIENIIQLKYKEIYNQFRSLVGLKLNYTVRLINDSTKPNGKKI